MRTSAFSSVWVTSHWNEVSRELFPRHNHAVVCRSPAMQAQQRHQPDGFPTPFLADSINAAPAFQKPVCAPIPLLLLATAHSEVCRRERGPPGPDTEYYKEQTILAAQWVARHAAVAWAYLVRWFWAAVAFCQAYYEAWTAKDAVP